MQRSSQNMEERQCLENIYQISNYLKCDVDKSTLAIMINLVENGVKPEHVVAIVEEIKRNKKEQ